MTKHIFSYAFVLLLFSNLLMSQRSSENNPGEINLSNGSVTGISLSGGSISSPPLFQVFPGSMTIRDVSGDSRITLLGSQIFESDIPQIILNGSVPAGQSKNFMTFRDDLTNNTWNIGLNSTDFGAYFDFKYSHSGGSMTTAYISSGGLFISSDKRLKNNIKSIDSALTSLMKVNATHYNRKVSPKKGEYGFIAQEIQEIFPDMVSIIPTEDGDQYMMNYAQMLPVLTKSIQEQQQLISKQELLINKLIKRLEYLEAK